MNLEERISSLLKDDIQRAVRDNPDAKITEIIEIVQYGRPLPKAKYSAIKVKAGLWEMVTSNDLRLTADLKLKIVEHPFD